MKKMGDLLEEFITSSGIYYHQNVISGHTKVKTDWKKTIFTMFLGHVIQKRTEYYFFGFDDDGMRIRQYENMNFIGDAVFIPWGDIFDFRYKKGIIEVEISFTYKNERYEMMLAHKVRNQPWMGENMDSLMDNNFYRPAV